MHKEFVPFGQTVNQQFYLQALKRLRDSVQKKRPEMWSSFWQKHNVNIILHPPYSPNLAPCDFFLFPHMKCQMKGKGFADVSEVKKKTLEV